MQSSPQRTWPRRRLLVRSAVSATLPPGWIWAAVTALIPYFLIGHGPGTSAVAVLGASRATWMSLHVWSTITMSLLTIVHVVLNRKGVSRSYRIVSGAPNRSSSFRPASRGLAWLGATLLIVVTTLGGFAFAAVDDTHSGGSGDRGESTVTSTDVEGAGIAARGNRNGRR